MPFFYSFFEKNKMNKLRIAFLIILVAFLGYVYFSNPRELVVNETAKIEGTTNKLRALMQRKKFWKLQLSYASVIYNESILPHPPSSTELRDIYHKMREVQKTLDTRMKSLYTPEEQMAIMLRTQADSLERAGKWKQLDEAGEKEKVMETERISKIILAIETKIHIEKTQPVKK